MTEAEKHSLPISDLLDMASKVLPDEAMQALSDIPQAHLRGVLERLLQASVIEYRQLTREDAAAIEVPAAWSLDKNTCTAPHGSIPYFARQTLKASASSGTMWTSRA